MLGVIGYLSAREQGLRNYAKEKGIKLRNLKSEGIKLYYPDGSQYIVSNWSYLKEVVDTGECLLYDGSIYKPKKVK